MSCYGDEQRRTESATQLTAVGFFEGDELGPAEGEVVGPAVGDLLGLLVEATGLAVGGVEGLFDGDEVGGALGGGGAGVCEIEIKEDLRSLRRLRMS